MRVKGSCHCGATKFEVEAPTEVTRCTCSICSKKGALYAYYPEADVAMDKPDTLGVYRWQSKMVEHHFCPHCGCNTMTRGPSWVDYKPDFAHMRIAINARLLDDFALDTVPVTVIDGKNLW